MRPTSTTLSATELVMSVNLAMRGEFSEIEPRHYRQIIRELQRIKCEAIADGDYFLAERAVNASRRVLALTSHNRFRDIATARVDSLCEQLQTKTTDRDDLVERTARAIAAAESRRDADLRAMERQNERELSEFDEQFAIDPPPEMRKFSPTLLQLRVRERYMVQAGRYTEATEAREEAERIERKESEEHRRRWVAHLRLQREELVNRQAEKMYVRRVNADQQIAKMRRTYGAAIDHQVKAVQHVAQQYSGACIVQGFAGQSRGGPRTEGALPRLKMPSVNPRAVAFRQRALINTLVYTRTTAHSARV
jgi:hypothetical protein